LLVLSLSKANKKALAKRARVLELITESTHSRNYDDIEIDEEWLEEYKDEIAKAKEVAQFENITPAERRKIEERMVAYTFRYNEKHWHSSGSDNRYIRDKIEPKVKDLMKTQRTTYYGTAADDDKLMVACGMIHPFAPRIRNKYTKICLDGVKAKTIDCFSLILQLLDLVMVSLQNQLLQLTVMMVRYITILTLIGIHHRLSESHRAMLNTLA
jgi:hypothetical protein